MREPPTRWYYEYITPDLFLASHLSNVLYSGVTRYQRVEIIETVPFGRCLVLDGRTQSSEADEFVYHEALVQPGLTSLANPSSVFIAGGGEGATLREVLSHSNVERVVMVDLDQEVVELCQKYLRDHHQGAFHDPRVELVHDDALRYLEEDTTRYDFIIIDIPDPLEGGPAYLLYTQEFYALVRERLNDGGLLAVQAGPAGPLNYHEEFTAVHNTLKSVFPIVTPYRAQIPSFGSYWGFILAGDVDPRSVPPEVIDSRISSDVTRLLRYYDGTMHAGLFTLPKYLRDGLVREERLISRDNPLFAM
jgi:spermidine synthase